MRFDMPANQNANRITREDVERIYKDAPFYANKFYLSMHEDGMIRLTFAELDNPSQLMNVRTSVVIPALAFRSFVALIKSNESNLNVMLKAISDTLSPAEKPDIAVIDGKTGPEMETEK